MEGMETNKGVKRRGVKRRRVKEGGGRMKEDALGWVEVVL